MEDKVKKEASGRSELERSERSEASDRKDKQFADVRRRLVAAAVFLAASRNRSLSNRQRREVLDFADGRDRAPFPHDQENGKGILSRKED